jgi:hypothetical protein
MKEILNHSTTIISDSSHEWGVSIPINNFQIDS